MSTGLEAVELLASNPMQVDLMLLDFNLPGVDGVGVYRAARSSRPDMKVIVISGNLNPDAKAEFTRLGQEEFLEKPYRLEEVGQRIRKLLAPAAA